MKGSHFHFFPFRHILIHLKYFKNDVNPTAIRPVHFRKFECEPFASKDQISKPYLIYRLMYAILFLLIFIYSLICNAIREYKLNYYFIYFTHWTLIVGVLYAVIYGGYALWVLIQYGSTQYKKGEAGDEQSVHSQSSSSSNVDKVPSSVVVAAKEFAKETNKWMEKDYSQATTRIPFTCNSLNCAESTIWILQSVAFNCTLISALAFWILIFDKNAVRAHCALAGSILVHGVTALFLLADICITAIPVHISHSVYSMIFAFIYFVFSASYHALNSQYPSNEDGKHPYIYHFLNWNGWWALLSTLVAPVVGVIVITIFHLIALLLYSFRLLFVYFYKHGIYNEHLYDYTNEYKNPKPNDSEQKKKKNKIVPIIKVEGSTSKQASKVDSKEAVELDGALTK